MKLGLTAKSLVCCVCKSNSNKIRHSNKKKVLLRRKKNNYLEIGFCPPKATVLVLTETTLPFIIYESL